MSVLPARRLVAGLIVLVAFVMLATSASAALDSKPPTKPGNLRVTAKTLTSVSMTWNASTDNSGNFSYRVRLWGDLTVVTLPKTQTSYTWTACRRASSTTSGWRQSTEAATSPRATCSSSRRCVTRRRLTARKPQRRDGDGLGGLALVGSLDG